MGGEIIGAQQRLEVLNAQQRLAISRRALLDQLQGRPPAGDQPRGGGALLDRFAWGGVARKVVDRWWRRHPANAAGKLARPLIERYTRKQPAKVMALAAAAGALLVLVRPWRLLSVTAVVAALLKSSDIADMVSTLMQKSGISKKEIRP